jgi:hypothetical protein
MSLEKAKSRFEINHYLWANENLRQEVENDFPYLQTIPSCRPVIAFFQELSEQQKRTAVSAFSKRGHAEALNLLGETKTEEEDKLLGDYFAFMKRDIV